MPTSDRVAVLSPGFAAPEVGPAVREQAVRRLTKLTGLVPVESPTTRLLNATPQARAADIDAAFRDPSIRAVLATIGGDDQITVIPHLDPALVRADLKPFMIALGDLGIVGAVCCVTPQLPSPRSFTLYRGKGPGQSVKTQR